MKLCINLERRSKRERKARREVRKLLRASKRLRRIYRDLNYIGRYDLSRVVQDARNTVAAEAKAKENSWDS